MLALLTVSVVGVVVAPYGAQQASRYALTAALVERHTVVLDEYERTLGIDRAVRDGHIYSDKAPGQPFLAAPFFFVGKTLGVEDGTVLRPERNLGLWWMTFVSSALPAAALVVMMYRRARIVAGNETMALAVVAAGFLGTLLLPFSTLLFGHVLAAALLYGAYLLVVGSGSWKRLAMAGLLTGVAVTVEYTAVLGLLVLMAFTSIQHRRRIVAFIVGGLPAAVALALYNNVAFGDPWTLSYQFSAFGEVAETARGVTSMFTRMGLSNTVGLFVDGRGLLVATPVVIIALAGAIWRSRRGFQPDAVMALAMFGAFILLPLLWANPWGGASPGPRYMAPAMAFMVVPLIWAFRRWRILTLTTIALSVLTMSAATFTDPLILPRDSHEGLGFWLGEVIRGHVVDTLPTMAFGPVGWLIHGLVILLVIWTMVASSKRLNIAAAFP